MFNPPYVPTSEEEVYGSQAARHIGASWAGGVDGMQITDIMLKSVEVTVAYSTKQIAGDSTLIDASLTQWPFLSGRIEAKQYTKNRKVDEGSIWFTWRGLSRADPFRNYIASYLSLSDRLGKAGRSRASIHCPLYAQSSLLAP